MSLDKNGREFTGIDEEMKKNIEDHSENVQIKEETEILEKVVEKEPENSSTQESQLSKETLQEATLKEIMDEMKGITTKVQPQEIMKELKPFSQRFLQFFFSLFPIFSWVWNYKREDLFGDIKAGLTVGIICIPGALIYGLIGSLPPIYGLYSTMWGMLIYAILGTSREMSTGATPMLSIVYASAVEMMNVPATIIVDGNEITNPEFLSSVLLISFIAGIIVFLIGFFKLGFLASLFSQPMISGFTSGAALTIILGQVKNLVGIRIPNIELIPELIPMIFGNLHKINPPTLLLSIISIVVLVGNNMSKYLKKIPAPLIMVVLGSIATLILSFVGFPPQGVFICGIRVIGTLPRGIPKPAFYVFDLLKFSNIGRILTSSIIVAIICVIESLSIAKFYSKINNYTVDTNQELIAIGTVNSLGILLNSPPSGGALSRSAINAYAGAKTQLASIIAFLCFLLCILLLTPLFFYVPFCVLSAMIVVACAKLIDVKEALYTWKVKKSDCFILISTFSVVILFGLVNGALYGIFVSLGILVVKMSRAELEILGRVRGSQDFIPKNEETVSNPEILVCRQKGDFKYLNIQHFRGVMGNLIEKKRSSNFPIRAVVIDGNNLRDLDTSIIYTLMEMESELRNMGIDLYFSNINNDEIITLEKSGFFDNFKKENIFVNLHLAVKYAEEILKTKQKPEPVVVIHDKADNLFNGNHETLLKIKGITDFYDYNLEKKSIEKEKRENALVFNEEKSEKIEPSLKMDD